MPRHCVGAGVCALPCASPKATSATDTQRWAAKDTREGTPMGGHGQPHEPRTGTTVGSHVHARGHGHGWAATCATNMRDSGQPCLPLGPRVGCHGQHSDDGLLHSSKITIFAEVRFPCALSRAPCPRHACHAHHPLAQLGRAKHILPRTISLQNINLDI